MNDRDLAALLVSRVCHDLISPIGAFSTGLEVLAEEEDPQMREEALRLLGKSARQARAKLMYARFAFGAAGSAGAEVPLSEARTLAADLLDGGKISLDWRLPDASWPKERVKIVLNLIGLAETCIPRGGVLSVEGTETGLSLTASGPQPRIARDVGLALEGREPEDGIDGRLAQAWLAGLLVRGSGGRLEASASPDAAVLRAIWA